MWSSVYASRAAIFALGAAAGSALGSSPTVRDGLRKLARNAIKGGILLGREAQCFADKIREDWEDLVAEAKADLDGPCAAECKEPHNHVHAAETKA